MNDGHQLDMIPVHQQSPGSIADLPTLAAPPNPLMTAAKLVRRRLKLAIPLALVARLHRCLRRLVSPKTEI